MAGPSQSAILGAVLLAAACGGSSASSHMPPQDAARAQAAIRAADAAGAHSDPQAAMYLGFAKQSASKANNLTKSGDKESANLLIGDAKADADLSLALTKQQQAQAKVQAAKQRLEMP